MAEGVRGFEGPFIEAAGAGNFKVYLYRPGSTDIQGAHDQAEVYFVISGIGTFESGLLKTPFAPGDALFVPAGEAHRFTGNDDVVVWAAFFGAPIDGKWRPACDEGNTAELELALENEQQKQARVWSVQWSGSEENAEGLGLVVGPHMACSRLSAEIEGGVVVYDKQNDGSLLATWAHSQSEPMRPGSGMARAVPPFGEGFEGRYEIQYSSSDDSPFGPPFELEIIQAADRYELTWRAGEIHLSGTGIVQSERLYSVWGNAKDAKSLGFSLLNLPVAGQKSAIDEQVLDPLVRQLSSRSWVREN